MNLTERWLSSSSPDLLNPSYNLYYEIPTPTLNVRSYSYKEGVSVYARARIEAIGKNVGLCFVVQKTPFEEHEWGAIERNPTNDPKALLIEGFCRDLNSEDAQIVEELLINLTIPSFTDSSKHIKWLGLAEAVGVICKNVFPNLRPKNSSFIVHCGYRRERYDDLLLTDGKI